MAKKFFMLITVVAVAAAMLSVPVSAETPDSLKDNIATSVDYRTESPADITGNLVFTKDADEITYVTYEDVVCVDRTCITGSNEGFRMQYQEDKYQKLNEVYTLETYVYMTESLYGTPVELWWGGDDSFALLGWDGYVFGFGQSDDSSLFDPAHSVVEDEERTLTEGWYHLVVTSDATTMNLYVNGELVGSGASPVGGMPGLWYYYNMKTEVKGYAMAYLTIYNVAASESQVALMFDPDAGIPDESPSASADPTPGASPSASNAPAESEDPSTSPSSDPTTPPPSDNGNPSTFDAGLLSLGVMALSSCLAMHKRRS